MIKAEWGTKRSCPKCATRFYDLTKDDPVSCINCGYNWIPESVLKSKQPMPFEVEKPPVEEPGFDARQENQRNVFSDQNRRYRISPAQIHIMAELGRFRVIARDDLTRSFDGLERGAQEKDLARLLRHSLIQQSPFRGPEDIPRVLLTLT